MAPDPLNKVIISPQFADALERIDGDHALFRLIAQMFIDDHRQMLENLQAHLLLDQRELAEHAAHALKGSISNFDTDIVRNAAREIEILCRQANLEEARNHLPALQSALQGLVAELQLYCAQEQ